MSRHGPASEAPGGPFADRSLLRAGQLLGVPSVVGSVADGSGVVPCLFSGPGFHDPPSPSASLLPGGAGAGQTRSWTATAPAANAHCRSAGALRYAFVSDDPCGRPFVPAEPPCSPLSSPSHPQPVPDALPVTSLPPGAGRALLCPCLHPDDETRGGGPRAEPPTDVGGSPSRSALGGGHPCGVHRRRSLQDPRRQRPARQPRSTPGRTGTPHPLQLPARERLGGAQAQGLHPRRDRPPGGRGNARSTVPLPD